MATYKEIQEYVRRENGFTVKSCWIAHVKEICGLNPSVSSNRHDVKKRVHPCPQNKMVPIMKAFKHFGMIE